MHCSNHPATPAIGNCSSCGKAICQNCSVTVDNKLICRPCAQQRYESLKSQLNKIATNPGAPGRNQKNGDMLPKLVIIGIVGLIVLIFLAALFVIASAVIAAFVFGTTGGTTQVHQYPSVAVHRVNATALSVTFMDTGGAASIKGLRILQPSLAQPNVVDPNTDISIGQPIIFSDQSLSSPAHLVVASTVDGKEQVVYDGKV